MRLEPKMSTAAPPPTPPLDFKPTPQGHPISVTMPTKSQVCRSLPTPRLSPVLHSKNGTLCDTDAEGVRHKHNVEGAAGVVTHPSLRREFNTSCRSLASACSRSTVPCSAASSSSRATAAA
jgi:hypothetical protein